MLHVGDFVFERMKGPCSLFNEALYKFRSLYYYCTTDKSKIISVYYKMYWREGPPMLTIKFIGC